MLRANRYALAAAQDVVALKARCARCTAVTTRCACGWASAARRVCCTWSAARSAEMFT